MPAASPTKCALEDAATSEATRDSAESSAPSTRSLRLTSDMISFRTTVIATADALEANGCENDDPSTSKRRHTVGEGEPPRFRTLKIESAEPTAPQDDKRAAFYSYSRPGSFTDRGRRHSSALTSCYSSRADSSSWIAGAAGVASSTIYSALVQTARRMGDAPALSAMAGSTEVSYSWMDLLDAVHRVARVLLRLGFAPGEGVVMSCTSSPAMYQLHLAALALGGVVAHVHNKWTASDLTDHVLPAARASVLVVDELSPNFVSALERTQRSNNGTVRAVVVLGDRQDPVDLLLDLDAPVNLLTMADVVAMAREPQTASVESVEAVASRVAPTQSCLIEFGHDADGGVRGACLSHDNALFTASTLAMSFGPLTSADRIVGYLPLSHAASQILELVLPLVCGLTVTCASPHKPLVKAIAKCRPSVFFATPATWARFSEQVACAKRDVNASVLAWAKTRATHNAKKLLFGRDAPRSLGYMLAKKLVLDAIKKKIGLESCAACYSVLAPLDFELERLFQSVDIPLYQLYGTAETSGFATLNFPHAWELGSCGRALKGTVLRCNEVSQDVRVRGRNVFLGYVRAASAPSTAVRFEPHVPAAGWFGLPHRGFLTPNGFLKIQAPRDFVVLANGDWIPLRPVERTLLAAMPELSRAVLIGDGRSFISVLLFLKTARGAAAAITAISTTGTNRGNKLPSSSGLLADDALQVAKGIRSKATTVAEAIKCQNWAVRFDEMLEALPEMCPAAGGHVRKWILMADNFSVESGEIDPDSGDVKRQTVESKYHALLDTLYS